MERRTHSLDSADLSAGLFGPVGVLAALAERERTGRGRLITTSLFEAQLALHVNLAMNLFVTGEAARPLRFRTSEPGAVPGIHRRGRFVRRRGRNDFLRATRQSPVPTVAMLNGACLGAAFELALACDIRIARPGVRIGLPEVKLGIPSVADAALLPGFVGLAKAREMILTGDLYDIAELGSAFANRVVEPDRLCAETERMLETLTAPTRQVIAAPKSLFETWLEAIEAYRASTTGLHTSGPDFTQGRPCVKSGPGV
jgi:enoyl-CoA hydratase/isomerase-like protein/CoA transferase family III